MLTYTNYKYLYPPRPENAVPSSGLKPYKEWVTQIKKNGTCNVIAVSPNKEITCMGRHKDLHKQWQVDEDSSRFLQKLPDAWYVFVAELLNNKVRGIRNINYVFDLLVADNKYLVGKTFAERQQALKNLFDSVSTPISETFSHWVYDPNLWLAKTHEDDPASVFDNVVSEEDEGIVIKNPEAKLALCNRKNSNSTWQVKCRKAHKNYGF